MTQNIYDTPEFFAGYSKLGRSVQGLDGAAEWPAMRALLPDLRNLRVVDLGCGFGWFCRWARAQGSGFGARAGCLREYARKGLPETQPVEGITYRRMDLENGSAPRSLLRSAVRSLCTTSKIWAVSSKRDPRCVDSRVQAGLFYRTSHLHGVTQAGMVDRRRRGIDHRPVDSDLKEGPRNNRLAGKGSRQAAPHPWNHGEPAAPHRLHPLPH